MPLYWREELPGIGRLGVWKITETEETLCSMRKLSKEENACVQSFSHETVRCRSLAYRVLLEQLLQRSVEIGHDELGAPYIVGESSHISASHSGEYAAVFYAEHCAVGIDIEKIQSRIASLRHKFMTMSELRDAENVEKYFTGSDLNKLKPNGLENAVWTVYWGGKESVYKMFSSEKPLFTTQIEIAPFTLEAAVSRAFFVGEQLKREVTLRFKRINGYMLVYTYEA
ncbi:MAG: 4'-phosphopantetheinyl transferase superfamily protein [Bacteroidales bacterium]|nr:4'-phosphopantetheinyl transferase superfamily protein [Bacteroidales bacterium]